MMRTLISALAFLEGADAIVALSGYMKAPSSIRGVSSASDSVMVAADLETAPGNQEPPEPPPSFKVESLAGISAPLGFFDPLGFSSEATEGKIRFYREVELKHARVAMLASLGFLVGEKFHPLFGGKIDVPSYIAFQETPLQTFWPVVVLFIAIPEIFSVFTFQSPFGGELWSMRTDHTPGDLGFDPLCLKPKSAAELKEMETKELNNGRLAMIGIAGMVAQELATGKML